MVCRRGEAAGGRGAITTTAAELTKRPPGTPLVSVVIPAYNAAPFIRATVASVLAQTWRWFECIVVDDGSTDATGEIVRSIDDPRVRCVRKPNERTVSAARNHGIGLAEGDFIALLDADDVWLPDKIRLQLDLFARRPELGMVYCGYAITDEQLRPHTYLNPPARDATFRRWLLLEGNGIGVSSTAMLSREAARAVGGFRPELSVSEDCEFATRVAAAFPVATVDRCLAFYRAHGGQGHRNLAAFEHDVLWICADRFGADEADAALRRRMLANLYTRLFFYELANRDIGRAAAHLRSVAATRRVDRLVLLPGEAAVRRIRRRVSASSSKQEKSALVAGGADHTVGHVSG